MSIVAMWRLLIAFAVAAMLGSGPVSAEPNVRNLRVGQHPDKIRFVLDLDARIDFSVFLLPDPYRIVVDLPQVSFELPDSAKSRRVGAISGWRFGLFEPGTSRLVIDAAQPLAVKAAFVLPPSGAQGNRLVLDLAATDRESFLAASAESVQRRMASRAPSLRAPRTPVDPGRRSDDKLVIAIDPGHGGVDPGAIGNSGIYEKRVTLLMAETLKDALEKSGRYEVVLTRQKDVFVRLRDRIAIARRANADLFISLHADSISQKSLRGMSVHTLSETASDSEAAALAARENKADIIAGMDFSDQVPEVADILIDLAQRRTMNLSVRLAGYVVEEMKQTTKMLRRPHRFAGFAVLKAPDVPSILVELGFLSNHTDEQNLKSEAYRAKLADALARAIDNYFRGVQSAFR